MADAWLVQQAVGAAKQLREAGLEHPASGQDGIHPRGSLSRCHLSKDDFPASGLILLITAV